MPADCVACFTHAGCTPGVLCASCVKANQDHCSAVCSKDRVPFPSAEAAVCRHTAHEHTQKQTLEQPLVQQQRSNAVGNLWHGGQWLIPEIQNDTTGIVCDWQHNLDLVYIDNAIRALALFGGGGVFDPKRVFFTGCSMGSAYTGWLSQCFHIKQPDAITAFATQSTGLKEKGTVRVQADTQYEISSEIIYFCKEGGTGGLIPSSFFPPHFLNTLKTA